MVQHENLQVHLILNKHCKLFSGTGNLKNTQVRLQINEANHDHCLLHTGQWPTPFHLHYTRYFPIQFIFQDITQDLIRKTPSTANISDNIWMWSHDEAMHLKLLTKLENSGTTHKMTQGSFMVPQINVFGHIVSAKGCSVKIEEKWTVGGLKLLLL